MKIINEHISFNRTAMTAKDKIMNFARGSHDIDSLGIGKVPLIKLWLDENKIEDYVINDDLTVSMEGEFVINWAILEKRGIPDYIVFKYKPDDEVALYSYLGNFKKLKEAIDKGGNPAVHDNFALRWASSKGHADIVEYLLNDDRVNPIIRKCAPVYSALIEKKYDVLKILYKNQQINNYIRNHFGAVTRKKIRQIINNKI